MPGVFSQTTVVSSCRHSARPVSPCRHASPLPMPRAVTPWRVRRTRLCPLSLPCPTCLPHLLPRFPLLTTRAPPRPPWLSSSMPSPGAAPRRSKPIGRSAASPFTSMPKESTRAGRNRRRRSFSSSPPAEARRSPPSRLPTTPATRAQVRAAISSASSPSTSPSSRAC